MGVVTSLRSEYGQLRALQGHARDGVAAEVGSGLLRHLRQRRKAMSEQPRPR